MSFELQTLGGAPPMELKLKIEQPSDVFFEKCEIKTCALAIKTLRHEIQNRPCRTLAKGIIALALLSAAYPAVIGFWACLKTFQITPLGDMESSNHEVAMLAAQNIGNTGMAITYIWQLREFVWHPITHLFKEKYNEAACKEIKNHYRSINKHDSDEVKSLVKSENEQLANYDGLPTAPDIYIEDIQQEINKNFSTRQIVYLTACQIKSDMSAASCWTIAKKTNLAFFVIALLSFSSAVLFAGTYGAYKPFALQSPFDLASSDSKKVETAVANYANVGHGLEYVATIGILTYKAMLFLFGKQYRKAMKTQINSVYNTHLQNSSLSIGASKLLEKRKRIHLKPYLSS